MGGRKRAAKSDRQTPPKRSSRIQKLAEQSSTLNGGGEHGVGADRVCVVCWDELGDPALSGAVSAGSPLARSGFTVGSFLARHEVVPSVFGEDGGRRLCSGCYELVVRCDELEFEFLGAIQILKEKNACPKKEPAPDAPDFVKQELMESYDDDPGALANEDDDPLPVSPSRSPPASPGFVGTESRKLPARTSKRTAGRKRPRARPEAPDGGTVGAEVKEEDRGGDENLDVKGEDEEEENPGENGVKSDDDDEDDDDGGGDDKNKTTRGAAKFCPLCGDKALPRKFADHLRLVHPGAKRVKALPIEFMRCDVPMCPYKTRHKQRLQNHMLLKHRIGKLFRCPDCGEGFPAKDRLLAHQHKVHGKEKTFKCEVCGKDYSTYMGLYLHSKTHSTEVKTRICDECGEEVDSRIYYNHVKKKHRPKKVEIVHCEHCGQQFKAKVNLKRHLARYHGVGELKLRSSNIVKECSQCGKRLKTDERFRAHVFLEHGVELKGLRKRECVLCREVFYVKVQYDAHMMLHSGVKKYACELCDYSTRFSANLVTHRRRSHPKRGTNPLVAVAVAMEAVAPVESPTPAVSSPKVEELPEPQEEDSFATTMEERPLLLVKDTDFVVRVADASPGVADLNPVVTATPTYEHVAPVTATLVSLHPVLTPVENGKPR